MGQIPSAKMVEPLANENEQQEGLFIGLASEASRLAEMLKTLQVHMTLIPDTAFPEELKTSGQALDCAEQGLSDFASIFETLSQTRLPLTHGDLRHAMSQASQQRIRDIPMTSNEAKPSKGVELF
jgi:hypothetical protein